VGFAALSGTLNSRIAEEIEPRWRTWSLCEHEDKVLWKNGSVVKITSAMKLVHNVPLGNLAKGDREKSDHHRQHHHRRHQHRSEIETRQIEKAHNNNVAKTRV
jgi:hypothetical protein